MLGGRKVRSNKGKKRGSYRTRKTHHAVRVRVSAKGKRKISRRKVRSNKGKKRGAYGPRTGRTRSGRKFRGGRRSMGGARSKTKEEIMKEYDGISDEAAQFLFDYNGCPSASRAGGHCMNWPTIYANLCDRGRYDNEEEVKDAKSVVCNSKGVESDEGEGVEGAKGEGVEGDGVEHVEKSNANAPEQTSNESCKSQPDVEEQWASKCAGFTKDDCNKAEHMFKCEWGKGRKCIDISEAARQEGLKGEKCGDKERMESSQSCLRLKKNGKELCKWVQPK